MQFRSKAERLEYLCMYAGQASDSDAKVVVHKPASRL